MPNIWKTLQRPFTVLAPMDDVTDVVFREIVAETARPDVYFTEFTNVEAICSKGKEVQINRFRYTPQQRPIIAQIWGLEPEHYAETTRLIVELGFDGVDINMGCPDRTVMKNGACSAFIRDRSRAQEVIAATREAAGNIPVSVKTRIGLGKIETESWIGFLLEQNLDAITVHGRTAKELSLVPCHWDEIGKAVTLRNTMKKETSIIGNGDVKNHAEALQKYEAFGVDGVMIGRGIFENLWAFDKHQTPHIPTPNERLTLLLKHARLYHNTWGNKKKFDVLKRFFKIYCSGFPGAQDLRIQLMESKNLEDVERTVVAYRG